MQDKIGYAPTAIILAENDELLRGLVCAEFGYRSDEHWGSTMDGSAWLYVEDVKTILDNDCKTLRQAVALLLLEGHHVKI